MCSRPRPAFVGIPAASRQSGILHASAQETTTCGVSGARPSSFVLAYGLLGCLFLASITEVLGAQPETSGLPAGAGIGLPATVVIPPSTFTMGDGIALCASGIREVTLTRSYEIGLLEITNSEYVERLQWAYDEGYVAVVDGAVVDMIGDGAYLVDLASPLTEIRFDPETELFSIEESPYAINNAYPGGYDPTQHPAKRVSWNGAAAYCDWINLANGLPLAYDHSSWECNGGDPYGAVGYRLPTDAEWECATSSGDDRAHPWGDAAPTCLLANFNPMSSECGRWTAPVGSRPDGANAYGMLDAGGNAGEWCNDFHECNLPSGSFVDPVGPETGAKKVLRGGGFFYTGVYTRCANRDADPPGFPFQAAGFRIARTALDPTGVPGQTDESGDTDEGPSGEGGAAVPRQVPFQVQNPASAGVLQLAAREDVDGTLTIVDAAGRNVRGFEVRLRAGKNTDLALRGLEAGVYYLRWAVGNGTATDSRGMAGGKVVIVD